MADAADVVDIYILSNVTNDSYAYVDYNISRMAHEDRPWFLQTISLLIIVTGLVLNAVVIAVCVRSDLRKRPANIYFMNLAIADTGFLVTWSFIIYEEFLQWTFVTCRILMALHLPTVFVSVNTLILIAVERLVAVKFPIQFKKFIRLQTVIWQMAILWITSFAEMIYPMLSSMVKTFTGVVRCFIGELFYIMYVAVIIPLVLMAIMYAIILFELHKRAKITAMRRKLHMLGTDEEEKIRKQNDDVERRKNNRPIILVLVIFILYVICYLPTLFPLVTNMKVEDFFANRIVLELAIGPYTLHACVSPILQLVFNTEMRKGLPDACHRRHTIVTGTRQSMATEEL